MDLEYAELEKRALVLRGAVAAVSLEAITGVDSCSTTHQLTLDDLGKTARQRDGGYERISFRERYDASMKTSPGVLKPVDDMNAAAVRVYGAEFLF